LSGLAPITVGKVADYLGLGAALAFTAIFFAAAAGLILLLPETRGGELD